MVKTTRPTLSLMSMMKEYLANQFTHHPARCGEIVGVISKYQIYHIIIQIGMLRQYKHKDLPAEVLQEHCLYAESLTRAFEELGTCFIKLGQLLSTRPDLLPPPYITALSRLQTMVAPVPGWQIALLIENELGAPLSHLFRFFDPQPLATASIAQVHKAILHNGKHVIIKAQRPGVQQQVQVDIEVLREIARFMTKHTSLGTRFGFLAIVQEFKQSLDQELDFLQEADNTQRVGQNIREFQHLITPKIYPIYSSCRVLTLSFISGRHLTRISADDLGRWKPETIAKELLSAYLKQIVVDGIFHCDPHPGNMLLADDGHLALLDFGMVGRLDTRQIESIMILLLAFSQRQGERVADMYLELIRIPDRFDRRAFTREICTLVCRYHDMSQKGMDIGRAMLDLVSIASAHRLSIPASFALLGKTLLNLDGALRILSPDLDLIQVIHQYMQQVIQQQALSQFSPSRIVARFLDTKHLFENMLRKTDILLDKLAYEQSTASGQVDRLDETIRRTSRRLSFSMIVSSLVLGIAMLIASRQRKP